MDISISASDVIATIALLISGWLALHQRSVNASQKRLNEMLITQGENQALDARKADLSANFIKLGKNKYRLKIWNKGKATAHNVRIEFPDGNDVIVESDLKSKFPMETLEQHGTVELIASVCLGTQLKHHIRLIWDDQRGENQEKSVYVTL